MNRKNLLDNERGASAVEFAIVLPLLMLLLMGTIEFGTLFYDKHMITNASREAARAGIVQQVPRVPAETAGTVKGYLQVARDYLHDSNGKSLLINYVNSNAAPTFTPNPPVPCTNFQNLLTVTVTYPYNYLFLDSIPGITSPENLSATTVMVCE